MSSERAGRPAAAPVPSADACAEAAAWIARLHGTERTESVEAGLRRWLASSEEHRTAFEMANDIWSSTERWPRQPVPAFVRWPRAGLVVTMPRALALASILGVAALAGLHVLKSREGLTTGVGEQRNLALEDGSHLSLNTDTRIRVDYDERQRQLTLEKGEALFEVAHEAGRPFVVIAGGRRITALGTTFLVSHGDGELAVTLVDGSVRVTSDATRAAAPEQVMRITTPGERVRFASEEEPVVDRPQLGPLFAWQRGHVVMDRMTLADAAAEMNRYSTVQLVIEGETASSLLVTGVARTGESGNFARAIASVYGLTVSDEGERIVLTAPTRGAAGAATAAGR